MAVPIEVLIMYLVTTIIYIVYQIHSEPSVSGVFLKCIPIVCLCAFVAGKMRFISTRKIEKDAASTRYHMATLIGLTLSGVGDACLVYTDQREFFILGLLFFAAAHVAYICAFGWTPFRAPLLIPCFVVSCLAFKVIYSGVVAHEVAILTAIYNGLITTMSWRALVQLETKRTWSQVAAVLGAFLFFVSDFVLATNKFSFAIPNAKTIIMMTYYAGQLGIALSVTEPNLDRKTD